MRNINLKIYKNPELQKIFRKNVVLAAYVFGSQIDNSTVKNSDIDIAVELLPEIDKKERFGLRLKLMNDLGKFFKKEVDLVILNDIKSVFFKYVVVKEGVLIYQKSDAASADIKSRILADYFDFKPFLEEYNKNYVQRSL